MKYVAITEHNVVVSSKLNKLNKKLDAKLEHKNFKTLGNDHVVILTDTDLEFCQDNRQISNQILTGLFKVKDPSRLYLIVLIILSLVSILQSCSGGAA